MKPSAPNKILWVIGLISGLLGIIGHFMTIEILTENSFILILLGFILLAVGTSFRGA